MKNISICAAPAAALAMTAACGDDIQVPLEDIDVSVRFSAVVGAAAAACGTTYDAQGGNSDQSFQLADLRFYVSNVRLIDDQSAEVPVVLDQSSPFQTGDVTLIDFEDASGLCDGTVETNNAVTGTAPPGTYDGIVFDLAVPFDVNHQDVTALSSPLNVMALYWAWLTGHKFAKIDIQETGGPNRFNFHLGSTQCTPTDGATAPPAMECSRANRPVIRFASFDPGADSITVDIGELFGDSDLAANTAMTPPGCQSFAAPTAQGDTDPDCQEIFAKVGLDLDSGDCVDGCSGQSIFSVAP